METKAAGEPDKRMIARQRLSILKKLESWLETPMIVLSAVWIYLMVAEFAWGTSQSSEGIATVIWVIFILDFLLRLSLAPGKLRYMRKNWLTVVSLLLPALRIFRIARIFRVLARFRGLQLVRVLGSVNRGMRALGKTMHRRGFGYVAALSVIVTFAGAAGMLFFERNLPGGEGLNDFGTALWWTAMIVTTMGSDYWPQTPEGRMLCLLLALYSFSVFGYFTGAIATYFIDRDADDESAGVVGHRDIELLRQDIAALRNELNGRRS